LTRPLWTLWDLAGPLRAGGLESNGTVSDHQPWRTAIVRHHKRSSSLTAGATPCADADAQQFEWR